MRQRYSVAQYRAAPTGGTQLAAQFLGTGTALRADVDPRPTHAAAREPVVQDAWLFPTQDGRVPLLKLMIGGERRRIRGASDQLHAPGIQRFHSWRASGKAGDLRTGQGGCDVRLSRARPEASPLLGGLPRYNAHIRVGLPRQATSAGKPAANPPGSRIVGGCREPEVSEFA